MGIILGVIFVAVGFYVFARTAPEWAQTQSLLMQLAARVSPDLREKLELLRALYFGSIAGMAGGGLLIVLGVVERLRRPASPPR